MIQNPHSDFTHAQKYRDEGEDHHASVVRWATGLADNEAHLQVLIEIGSALRFMPAGRIQAAVGSSKNITPYNCFVAGTIHDSFVHGWDNMGKNSIMGTATEAATTMRMGGGIGYDWSPLRPSNDLIVGVQANTDGPIAFMPINDAVCEATSSAGNRRGAQMGVLRIDHPDIRKFLNAKQPGANMQKLWDMVEAMPGDDPMRADLATALQETLKLKGFNLSIAVTDEFMHCLLEGRMFDLVWGGKVYDTIDPAILWDEVMDSTWHWAEPGVLFIDTINRMNNLKYCELIAASNPCGEQPLPPYGACLLGSFNLTKYMLWDDQVLEWYFDFDQLTRDIAPVIRAMDNVIDMATYPLPEQEAEAKSKRRMGIGITGLANAAEAQGFMYGTPEFLQFQEEVMRTIANGSYDASVDLAIEKGPFPMFDADQYLDSEFIKQSIALTIQDRIRTHGIRNSHLLSVAPTGTISYAADNISSGCEPVIMYEGTRKMIMDEGEVIVEVNDYGWQVFGVKGTLADDVTAQQHVAVLAMATKWVDSAVSKTCNVSPTMPRDEFSQLYISAWEQGCKGCTTFNAGGKRIGIFTPKEPAEEQITAGGTCEIDWSTGRSNCE